MTLAGPRGDAGSSQGGKLRSPTCGSQKGHWAGSALAQKKALIVRLRWSAVQGGGGGRQPVLRVGSGRLFFWGACRGQCRMRVSHPQSHITSSGRGEGMCPVWEMGTEEKVAHPGLGLMV